METEKEHGLNWEGSNKQFLVFEPGLLITSFYMPAMLGISPPKEYGRNAFIKAQMVVAGKRAQIVCTVRSMVSVLLELVQESANFSHLEHFEETDKLFDSKMKLTRIFYNIPQDLMEDYWSFVNGKYSMISTASRERIKIVSGVRYKVSSGKSFIYDKKILALEKSPILRAFIEKMLDVVIDENAELLDKPGYNDYYLSEAVMDACVLDLNSGVDFFPGKK